MNARTKTGFAILQAAVLTGILGNVLLRQMPWGLNVFLFVAVFVAAMAGLMLRNRPEMLTKQNVSLFGAMIFFSAMFVWRDSIELRVYDTFAIIAIMSVLMFSPLKITTHLAGAYHYIIGFLWSGISAVFAPITLMVADIDWKSIPATGRNKHIFSVLRGLLVALPILLIFGALFMAADAVYQGMVERIFNVPADVVFTHVLLSAVLAWMSAGYLRSIIMGGSPEFAVATDINSERTDPKKGVVENMKGDVEVNPTALADNLSILEHINSSEEKIGGETETPKEKTSWRNFDNTAISQTFTFGAVETVIILGLVNLLFLSFVIVQVPYLFGGMELVQNTPDFKLADYARRGFGELVAVAAMVLPILLISHWLLRKDSSVNEKLFRVLAGIQIALLFVIMASAAQRLFLLTGNLGYGLTTIRLYPMIFMVWLAIVFIWFGVTVLRGSRQYFAWGAMWAALAVLGAAHVLNPDEFIVRTNIRLMQEGRAFDARYNIDLSDDAVPALLEALPLMNAEQQCVVKSKLSHRFGETANEVDLRSWNLARTAARDRMNAEIENLKIDGCSENMQWFNYHNRGDF